MDRLIFNAYAGLKNSSIDLKVLTHDLSNISTVGFKRSLALATQAMKALGPGFESRLQPLGRDIDRVKLEAGPMVATGRSLDVAMQGQTVLAVQAKNNEVAFTRRGDLRVSVDGALETGAGHLVLGEDGPITVPAGFALRINPDGTVVGSNPAQAGVAAEQVLGQLRLRDAGNASLSRREDGLFAVSGQPPGTDIVNGTALVGVVTGMIENSNVSAVDALTRLIHHSRSFEMQVKAIKEVKDLDANSTTMLKLG